MIKCNKRYLQLTKQSDNGSQKWTTEEDQVLKDHVARYGKKGWSKVANLLPGRLAKQCRERWIYQINPKINTKKWTEEEDIQLA